MSIKPEILDEILKDYEKPEDLLSQNGLLQQLTKALVDRALNTEITHRSNYKKQNSGGNRVGNSRNGYSTKTLKTGRGQDNINIQHNGDDKFTSQVNRKNQNSTTDLDEKIISLYSRGMTTREIQGHLEEIYDVEVSTTHISNVTDSVLDEVRSWQSRPLDSVYPILYLDALQVKVKSGESSQQSDLLSVWRESARLERGLRHLGIRQ
jgi:putative transposase